MPKNKVQEVIFTILMVFVMVYAMICYNIAVETGGMTNLVFLHAFRELLIMGPIAFLLDFFLVGGLAKKAAFRIVNPEKDNPFLLVLGISAVPGVRPEIHDWPCRRSSGQHYSRSWRTP